MTKKIPSSLFKYQSLASPHTIENLQKCQIWFSKPEKLNDPFIRLVSLISRTLLNPLPLLTKSIKWKYEKEWRLIHMQGDRALKYDAKALKAIYFGCALANKEIEKIVKLPARSAPQLYRMKRSEREFKLEFESYRP